MLGLASLERPVRPLSCRETFGTVPKGVTCLPATCIGTYEVQQAVSGFLKNTRSPKASLPSPPALKEPVGLFLGQAVLLLGLQETFVS